MDLNTIREAVRKQPFEPFTLHLADGRTERINHPEFVAIGTRIVVVVREDNSFANIEPLLIVSLEMHAPKTKGGNGAAKKKRGK